MTKVLIAVCLAGLLAGCMTTITTPTPQNAARPVPPERVLLRTQGDARIVIVRDSGYVGSACYLALYVNGSLAARIDPGESVSFSIAPGEVLLSVGYDPQGQGLCQLNVVQRPVHRTVESVVQAGQQKVFRIFTQLNVGPMITRQDL